MTHAWRTHLAVSTHDAVSKRSLTSKTWPLSCRFSPFLMVASRKNDPTTISLNPARSTNAPATGAGAAIAVKAVRHCCLLRLSPSHARRTARGAACVFQGALYRSRTECIWHSTADPKAAGSNACRGGLTSTEAKCPSPVYCAIQPCSRSKFPEVFTTRSLIIT